MARHGVGTRRESHRFVVVVYVREDTASTSWPGNVVHIAAPGVLPALDAAEAVRIPFERLDNLAPLLRDLIGGAPMVHKAVGA
ncbi:MAG: hypothetical protein ACXW3O_00610 [Brevundimonas sp.]